MKTLRSIENAGSPSEGRSQRARVFAGLLTGGMIGASVIGYAYLSPATYEATSVVRVDPAPGAAAPDLKGSEASARLREGLLQREVLERLVAARVRNSPGESPSSAARSVREAVDIESLDGRSFELSVKDAEPVHAAELANVLAQRAAHSAPQILGGGTREAELSKLRRDRQSVNDELVRFLAAHPELTSRTEETRTPGSAAAPMAPDPKLAELRAERARIELRLAPRESEGGTQNPYSNPSTVDGETPELERRLAELNATLARAPKRMPAPEPEPEPDVAVTEELARLSRRAAELKAEEEAARSAPPTLISRVARRASPPEAPVEPNRALILFLGLLAALVSGAAVATWRRSGLPLASVRPTSDMDLSRKVETEQPPSRPAPAPPPSEPSGAASSGRAAFATSDHAPEAVRQASGLELATTQQAVVDAILFPSASSPLASTAHSLEAQKAETPPSSARRPRQENPPSSAPRAIVRTAVDTRRGDPERGPSRKAVVEVNADLSPRASDWSSPWRSKESEGALPVVRTTQVLGSPIPPILAPGSRRAPASGGRERPKAAASSTGYSYVSVPPPADLGGEASVSSPRESGSLTGAPQVQAERVEAGWRPDLSLLPESRRELCDELYSEAVVGCRVVVLAGPSDAGDEKSRVAAELSLALAERPHTRVLMVEGNLRRPQAHRFLRVAMPRGSGLSQQLRARVGAGNPAPWTVIECTQTLHALCESETPITDLILSQAFEHGMKELRRLYDVIVIDGPFTSDVAACRAVEDVVDSAIFVHLRSKTLEAAEASALFPGKRVALIAAAG